MSKQCDWIDSRIPDQFSEDPGVKRLVDAHLAACPACREQVKGNERVDQLLISYVESRMVRAQAEPVGETRRLFAVAAALAAIAALVWIGTWPLPSGAPTDAPLPAVAENEVDGGGPILSKPSDNSSTSAAPAEEDSAPATASNVSFYVVDAAGYAYTLDDFDGSVLVLGVFDNTGTSRRDIARLYDALPLADDLRFVAVGLDAAIPDPARSLPFMVNRGSNLLGTQAGEFAILTRGGAVVRRGLLSDPQLKEIVRGSLSGLGVTVPD